VHRLTCERAGIGHRATVTTNATVTNENGAAPGAADRRARNIGAGPEDAPEDGLGSDVIYIHISIH